jgi:hypothetical protein
MSQQTSADKARTCFCDSRHGCNRPNDPVCPNVGADLGRVQTTCIEHAYGTAERLSFQIKVF